MNSQPVSPGPGQESVRDYPRPPRCEDCSRRIEVFFDDIRIASTTQSKRVLETSHPPVYYIPPEDVKTEHLFAVFGRTWCEWKGLASYYDLQIGDRLVPSAAWTYRDPSPGFESLRDHFAFYPGKADLCLVDGEKVRAQDGDFYGGWITDDIVGPFKGSPGTSGW